MRIEIVMPKWGLTMTEATIVRWIRGAGETVAEGEPVVEVETEKANAEVEAPSAGVIAEVLVEVGAVVSVGAVIAILDPSDGGGAAAGRTVTRDTAPGREGGTVTVRPAPEPAIPQSPAIHLKSAAEVGRASPLARRSAHELGVDLDGLIGTGKNGLITEADVRVAAEGRARAPARDSISAGVLAPVRTERLAGMRRAIADAMHLSLAQGAQVTLTRETSVGGAIAVRERAGNETTLTDVLLATVARALTRHPTLNAHLVNDELQIFETVNVGIAVALDDGLVTPVVRCAHRLGLDEITRRRQRLVEAARKKSLRQPDIEDGTFTITNLGAYGIDAFTPILNLPQVAMLGVGSVRQRPVFANGGIVPRSECVLSLTFDHRALDGAPAALLLGEIAELLGDEVRLEKEIA